MAEPSIFTFMRHGPTDWNADKRIQGQTESRLNSQGRDMALEWGRALARKQDQAAPARRFTRILSSDLDRAVETARLVNRSLVPLQGPPHGLPLDLDQDLREQDWGDWTGGRVNELRKTERGEVERQEARGWEFRPPGGEDRRAVLARVVGALERAAARHRGERILVVTHLGVLKCVFYHLLGMKFLPQEGDPLEPYTLHTASLDPAAMARPGAESGAGLKLVRINEAF